jgi:peptide/nickel transport system substrate-binding protein
MVWDIDAKLQEDVARPIIMHNQVAGCWQPFVRNYGLMVNSSYNGWRFDEVWLNK